MIAHGHCPCGCDHPQPIGPFADSEEVPEQYRGKAVCGCCYFDDGSLCVMIPCTPETCVDDG